MKKILTILFSSLLISATANAGGMIGLKAGYGELQGEKNSYTAGSNTYAAQSKSVESGVAAVFAEVNVMDGPVSVGVEFIPIDANLSIDCLLYTSPSPRD